MASQISEFDQDFSNLYQHFTKKGSDFGLVWGHQWIGVINSKKVLHAKQFWIVSGTVAEILVIDSQVLGLKFANSRKYLNYKEIKFLSIHSLNRMLQWSELDAFVLLLGYLQWFPIRYYIFEYFYACIRTYYTDAVQGLGFHGC